MGQKFIAKAEIKIKAPVSRVWEALTKPELVKQYLFGTEVVSDWRAGSPITYKGEWKGKAYEDKGKILKIEPEKLLASTYWSSMGGKPDTPENYNTVTYEMAMIGPETRLTLTQDNIGSQQEADHSRQNWEMVLGKMKDILEK